jgi:hypothetical protein
MTTVTRDYGYKNFEGTGIANEILASDQMQEISILIDSTCRDTGHTGETQNLRRGLVLYFDSVAKTYKELTLAAQSPSAVVLAEDIPNMNLVSDNVVAKAYYKATFKAGSLYDNSGLFDPDQCQRISIRDNL